MTGKREVGGLFYRRSLKEESIIIEVTVTFSDFNIKMMRPIFQSSNTYGLIKLNYDIGKLDTITSRKPPQNKYYEYICRTGTQKLPYGGGKVAEAGMPCWE